MLCGLVDLGTHCEDQVWPIGQSFPWGKRKGGKICSWWRCVGILAYCSGCCPSLHPSIHREMDYMSRCSHGQKSSIPQHVLPLCLLPLRFLLWWQTHNQMSPVSFLRAWKTECWEITLWAQWEEPVWCIIDLCPELCPSSPFTSPIMPFSAETLYPSIYLSICMCIKLVYLAKGLQCKARQAHVVIILCGI